MFLCERLFLCLTLCLCAGENQLSVIVLSIRDCGVALGNRMQMDTASFFNRKTSLMYNRLTVKSMHKSNLCSMPCYNLGQKEGREN